MDTTLEPQTSSKPSKQWRVVLLVCLLIATAWAFFNRGRADFGFNLSGKPSVDTGKRMLRAIIASQGQGAIGLVRFKKTNGIEREMSGQRFYEMQYEAEIQFSKIGSWLKHDDNSFIFSANQYGQGAMARFGASMDGAVNVVPSQRETVRGTLTFEKTEKGWKGDDGVIY